MLNVTAMLIIVALLAAAFGFWALVGSAAVVAKFVGAIFLLAAAWTAWDHHHTPHS